MKKITMLLFMAALLTPDFLFSQEEKKSKQQKATDAITWLETHNLAKPLIQRIQEEYREYRQDWEIGNTKKKPLQEDLDWFGSNRYQIKTKFILLKIQFEQFTVDVNTILTEMLYHPDKPLFHQLSDRALFRVNMAIHREGLQYLSRKLSNHVSRFFADDKTSDALPDFDLKTVCKSSRLLNIKGYRHQAVDFEAIKALHEFLLQYPNFKEQFKTLLSFDFGTFECICIKRFSSFDSLAHARFGPLRTPRPFAARYGIQEITVNPELFFDELIHNYLTVKDSTTDQVRYLTDQEIQERAAHVRALVTLLDEQPDIYLLLSLQIEALIIENLLDKKGFIIPRNQESILASHFFDHLKEWSTDE